MLAIDTNDYNTKDIARIIREWTELSQKDFANTLHKSKRTIEAWEYGETTMSFLEKAKKHNIEIILRKK